NATTPKPSKDRPKDHRATTRVRSAFRCCMLPSVGKKFGPDNVKHRRLTEPRTELWCPPSCKGKRNLLRPGAQRGPRERRGTVRRAPHEIPPPPSHRAEGKAGSWTHRGPLAGDSKWSAAAGRAGSPPG